MGPQNHNNTYLTFVDFSFANKYVIRVGRHLAHVYEVDFSNNGFIEILPQTGFKMLKLIVIKTLLLIIATVTIQFASVSIESRMLFVESIQAWL